MLESLRALHAPRERRELAARAHALERRERLGKTLGLLLGEPHEDLHERSLEARLAALPCSARRASERGGSRALERVLDHLDQIDEADRRAARPVLDAEEREEHFAQRGALGTGELTQRLEGVEQTLARFLVATEREQDATALQAHLGDEHRVERLQIVLHGAIDGLQRSLPVVACETGLCERHEASHVLRELARGELRHETERALEHAARVRPRPCQEQRRRAQTSLEGSPRCLGVDRRQRGCRRAVPGQLPSSTSADPPEIASCHAGEPSTPTP